MSRLIDKVNEVMADEWACVRALRRAESQCDDPGQLEVLRRVRKDCSVNCVALANVVRTLGGQPIDVPSARFSLKLLDEDVAGAIDLAQSAQQHIVAEIGTLLDEPDLKSARGSLDLVRQMHQENVRWLNSATSGRR